MLLLLLIAVNAWKLSLVIEYDNPEAVQNLQLPRLKVSVTGTYDPTAMTLNNVDVKVETTANTVAQMVKSKVESYLGICELTNRAPLAELASCVLSSIKDVIALTNLEAGTLKVSNGLDLAGVAFVQMSGDVVAAVAGKSLNGIENYVAKAYLEGIEESLELVLSSGNIKLRVTGESFVTPQKAFYVLVRWPEGRGVIALTAPPLAPPNLQGTNPLTVTFARDIVKYFVAVSPAPLPRTVLLYFQQPVRSVVIPFEGVTVEVAPPRPRPVAANCNLSLAVASRGYHNITLISDIYKITVKAKGFEYVTLPSVCNGTALLKVDSSYALLNLTKVVGKKIVAIPKSPVLRLVVVKTGEPAAVVVGGVEVPCSSDACYLLVPSGQTEVKLVGLISKTSTSVTIPSAARELSVKFPPPPPTTGCMVKFVSPKPIDVTVATGTSVFTIKVGRSPSPVILPCGKEVYVKVGGYEAKINVTSGEWIYLCPSQYAVGGESVKINTTMKPPLSISCDGGMSWAVVGNSTFTMVKPRFAYVELKIVSADGATVDVILPEGVKVIRLRPTKTPQIKRIAVPQVSLNAVEKIVIKGLPEAQVIISNGTHYLEYVVRRSAYVALPQEWLSQKLRMQVKAPGGVLINTTVPPPAGEGSVAPIYIMANNSMVVNYKSLKLLVFRGDALAQAPVQINGEKVLVNGSVILVVPDDVVKISVAGREYLVYANGQSFNITLPAVRPVPLTLPVEVSVYFEGKPAKATVKFVFPNYTIAYTINGNATVLLPSFAANVTARATFSVGDVACTLTLPSLETRIGVSRVVSPIVALLSKRGTCYAYKIVAVGGGLFKSPATVKVYFDGHELTVRGSLIVIYDKPTAEVIFNNKSYTAVAGGTLYLKKPAEQKRPEQRPQEAPKATTNIVTAIRTVGKWNPVGELPGMLSLATGMILALGVLNSGVTGTSPAYAVAVVLASVSLILGLVTLGMILARYFST
ncbi:MAG: hypothetical protein GXO07_04025 [Crenarchaeota archaeon]|nr:hypothetical protein [Thermoproteota archaeon]